MNASNLETDIQTPQEDAKVIAPSAPEQKPVIPLPVAGSAVPVQAAAVAGAEPIKQEDSCPSAPDESSDAKRKLPEGVEEESRSPKKLCTEDAQKSLQAQTEAAVVAPPAATAPPAPVMASKEGIAFFSDNDVLSGRGGGTNVHPGNRNFRDLINLHRRAYLKARKNDKPAISRAIVRSIRENNGRFLKKDEKSGLWYEIGDDAAREKTSQALRQRAPEMRKLLFDTEREEARAAAEEQLRQQRMLMGMTPELMNMNPMMRQAGLNNMPAAQGNPMLNPAFLAMANQKQGVNNMNDPYTQMFSAALLGGGMQRFAPK